MGSSYNVGYRVQEYALVVGRRVDHEFVHVRVIIHWHPVT